MKHTISNPLAYLLEMNEMLNKKMCDLVIKIYFSHLLVLDFSQSSPVSDTEDPSDQNILLLSVCLTGVSIEAGNLATCFPNHHRLLSNIKFHSSALSFLSHTISHLLNMKYGIKRTRFLCCLHFFLLLY